MSSRSPTDVGVASDGEPSAGAAPAEARETHFDFSLAWPASVPDMGTAHRYLVGQANPPDVLAEFNERFLNKLPPSDRELLAREGVGAAGAVRDALVMEWRLGAALYVRPALGPKVDAAQLDRLLTQTDAALTQLTESLEGAGEGAAQVQAHRDELARLAVDVSSEATGAFEQPSGPIDRALLEQPPAPPPPRKTPVSVTKVSASRGREVRVPVAVLALALLGAALAFGAYFLWYEPPKPFTLAGAPHGSFTSGNYLHSLSGEPFEPRELQAFDAKLRAQGRTLRQLTPTSYEMVPWVPEKPAPEPPSLPAAEGEPTEAPSSPTTGAASP